jgi:hypothetical protein
MNPNQHWGGMRGGEYAGGDFGAYWSYPAVLPRPAQFPAPVGAWRRARGARILKIIDFLKVYKDFRKKAGQAGIKSVGRTGLKGMIAYGWRTAPPQVGSEVDSVTNSACQCSLEASQVSPIAFRFNQIAPIVGAIWVQSGLGFDPRQHPSVATASRSHTPVRTLGERRLAPS